MRMMCYDCREIVDVVDGECIQCGGDDLGYVPTCLLCGTEHDEDGILCRGCEDKVVRILNTAIDETRGDKALEHSRNNIKYILQEELKRI